MAGIKETSEFLVGVNEVGIVAAMAFKDGLQFSDAELFYMSFMQNADFKAKVIAAYENFKEIGGEVSDLDMTEILQLVMLQASYIPRIIDALKKV